MLCILFSSSLVLWNYFNILEKLNTFSISHGCFLENDWLCKLYNLKHEKIELDQDGCSCLIPKSLTLSYWGSWGQYYKKQQDFWYKIFDIPTPSHAIPHHNLIENIWAQHLNWRVWSSWGWVRRGLNILLYPWLIHFILDFIVSGSYFLTRKKQKKLEIIIQNITKHNYHQWLLVGVVVFWSWSSHDIWWF